jgi:aromatic ring-cleaving dioxygenase
MFLPPLSPRTPSVVSGRHGAHGPHSRAMYRQIFRTKNHLKIIINFKNQ